MASNLPGWRWLGLAGVALLATLLTTLLSRNFVYGFGHADRPILHFIALYGVGWVVLVAAFWMLRKGTEAPGLGFVLIISLGLRILLFPSELIQENDVYRYVLDGQVLLHGGNPYEFSPLELQAQGTLASRGIFASEDAQIVFDRIGYPAVTTVYPPVAQLAFAAGSALGGWNWLGQRLVFSLVDLLVIAALVYLLTLLALPRCWILLYAWNPLVLKEVTNSCHVDVLVALFTLLLVMGLVRFDTAGSRVWVVVSGLAWGLAVLTKIYPLILGPACLVWICRRDRRMREGILFGGLGTLIILLGLIPFLSIGANQLTKGLVTYASSWRMNQGVFDIFNWMFSRPRLASWTVVVVVAITLPLLRRTRSINAFVENLHWILLIWFLLLPAVFPWYAIPLVSLLVLYPGSRATLPLVVLSGVVVLYYLTFFYDYREYMDQWWSWTRFIEHAAIGGAILFSLLPGCSQRRSYPN